MISLEEYLKNAEPEDLTDEILANAQITVDRTNQLLDRAGARADHVQTSGVRSRAANARLAGASATSNHLSGQAADISDLDRYLADWSVANLEVLEEVGCWMEDPRWTPTWVHWQIVPPKSGKRIYIPSLKPPLDPSYEVTWA
jgi:hypothetical protein